MLEWNHLRKAINQSGGAAVQVVNPQRFVHCVRQLARIKNRPDVATELQCDMDDFFHFFFTDPPGNVFDFDMLWMGEEKPTYRSEIWSLDGQTLLSSKTETYSILNLEIPVDLGLPEITLYDCLEDYTSSEILDGDNQWYNETTSAYQSIQKRLQFASFPRVLLIVLKRFSPDGTSKIDNFVNYPLTLDLSRYAGAGGRRRPAPYQLQGVCFHQGLLRGGHYTSATRHPHTGEWFYYDDEKVGKIQSPVSPQAYCFLYIS
jgi:ubiquitin C-terminal hydrolase